MSVEQVVRKRISYRRFSHKPVSEEDVRDILNIAKVCAKRGNTQPWHCYVLSGEAKKSLTKAILNSSGMSPKGEFQMYPSKDDMPSDLYDVYMKRRRTLAAEMYRLMGVSYQDKKGRVEAMMKNFDFFGAPVGIIVTCDRCIDVNGWGHVGAFLQSICLLAEERGNGNMFARGICNLS